MPVARSAVERKARTTHPYIRSQAQPVDPIQQRGRGVHGRPAFESNAGPDDRLVGSKGIRTEAVRLGI